MEQPDGEEAGRQGAEEGGPLVEGRGDPEVEDRPSGPGEAVERALHGDLVLPGLEIDDAERAAGQRVEAVVHPRPQAPLRPRPPGGEGEREQQLIRGSGQRPGPGPHQRGGTRSIHLKKVLRRPDLSGVLRSAGTGPPCRWRCAVREGDCSSEQYE